ALQRTDRFGRLLLQEQILRLAGEQKLAQRAGELRLQKSLAHLRHGRPVGTSSKLPPERRQDRTQPVHVVFGRRSRGIPILEPDPSNAPALSDEQFALGRREG